MTPTLETPRLILRPLELADAAQAQALFPQWEIVRYLANVVPWPYRQNGPYKFYRDVALPAVERGDEWAWTLRLQHRPDQLIGAISLMRNERDNRGFWLGLHWQRQGLVSEASEVVTDYWFDVLRFPVMRVSKAVANTGSRRISEKQGMRVVATEDRDYVSSRFRRRYGRSLRKNSAAANTSLNQVPVLEKTIFISTLKSICRCWQSVPLSSEAHQGRRQPCY
jgi:RimJ/RimL family protein N-acetyltransferase